MYAEARGFNNGTCEGSDSGEDENDTIWLSLETMAWLKPLEQVVHHNKEAISKALCYLCRWGAIKQRYAMDRQGGILIQDILLWHRSFVRDGITENEIRAVVAEEHLLPTKRKQRLAVYNDDQGRLRVKAYQGHSEDVGASIDDSQAFFEIKNARDLEQLGYICCHATHWKYWKRIQFEGLKSCYRKHVHFAKQIPSRWETDKEVLILLDVKKWLEDGGKLYLSENDVILTPGFQGVVSPSYFEQVRHIQSTKRIWWSC